MPKHFYLCPSITSKELDITECVHIHTHTQFVMISGLQAAKGSRAVLNSFKGI